MYAHNYHLKKVAIYYNKIFFLFCIFLFHLFYYFLSLFSVFFFSFFNTLSCNNCKQRKTVVVKTATNICSSTTASICHCSSSSRHFNRVVCRPVCSSNSGWSTKERMAWFVFFFVFSLCICLFLVHRQFGTVYMQCNVIPRSFSLTLLVRFVKVWFFFMLLFDCGFNFNLFCLQFVVCIWHCYWY